jgi:hypothetical protein
MRKNLVRQLRSLKHEVVKPSAGWVQKNRSLLLSQIRNTVSEKESVPFNTRIATALALFMPQTIIAGTVRFVAGFLVISVVAPSLYYGTVMASQGALPGEGLYEAKRYTEKIQVTVVSLIGNSQDETKLHVELAKRRADETNIISRDPEKVGNIASTVADLKSELSTISDKLDQTNNNLSADTAKDIKTNTDQIKNVLQDAKDSLLTASPDSNLADQVKQTKDMVQDVSVKAVEVLVTKHLGGDTSVSRDDVKAAIDSTVQGVVGDVNQSKQNIAGVQTILQSAKTEVSSFAAASSSDPVVSSTVKTITTAYDQANQAVQVTDTISQEANRTVTEVQKLLGSDNLTQAVNRMKDLTQASQSVETISDKTIEQTQPLIPLEVMKVLVATDTTTISATTGTVQFNTTTLNVSTTVPRATSTTSTKTN